MNTHSCARRPVSRRAPHPFAPTPLLVALLVVAATAGPAGAAVQYEAVHGTLHDFARAPDGGRGSGAVFDETCRFCHVAPGAGDAAAPTSAVAVPAARAYRTRAGSGFLYPESRACLACHDGTTSGAVAVHGFRNLGTDLRDDHPVSTAYDPSADAGLRPAAEVRTAGLKLFERPEGPTIECATCHDPHGASHEPAFLRIANDRSRLCRVCHLR
ncbi:MAG: hypothetical protein D6701_13445 [Gemmatimonadetes bacterium]|nr:MAG: hypothetical protein D6701_13445 [Gemmatimonadota bacterium]